ncbi:zinc finger CCCH domain-containing protein 29-like [Magnolia sinica]|uniref:zinc finger CCCH domain-containing protein 29-like n=1 Tax=Magnolia sinica TaxID=86752 RepID=UPI002657ECD5|nr:zinc finger CCCH domain-containing protein 29-like [Magnolia sinica]
MCVIPDTVKRKSSPAEFISMDSKIQDQKGPFPSSNLLELSASNDLIAFKRAVEEDGLAINEAAYWYGKRTGSRKMGYEQRTPLMIAAMFGSMDVLKYILSTDGVDVNMSCGLDGATALHCAAAGGSASASEIVKLLINASADVDSLDAHGNRPGDVIAPASPTEKQKSLEMMLKGIRGSSGREEENSASSGQNISNLNENQQPLEEQVLEKREYPVDFSMPDVNSGIYGTDEFRMYTFKVKPCSRAYSHDWTECPFVHPGENARRRDPCKYNYSCVPCPEFRKGACRLGDACEYAHGVFESWLHPWQYRTRLCKDETGCTRRVCFFAHKREELRPVHASTGAAMLSPRSSFAGALPLDMTTSNGAPSGMMLPTTTAPTSPSLSSWQNLPGVIPPTLQLLGSRLKTVLSARDLGLDMEMPGLEGYQQQLMDEISNLSGRTNAFAAAAAALAASSGSRSGKFSRASSVTPSNLEDVFGSLDPPTLSQLQGISLKAAAAASHFQSPSGRMAHQNVNPQLHSAYSSSPSSSPVRTSLASSSFGLDPTSAAAVMNSRSSAFAKRSQSFSERAMMNRHPSHSTMATTTTETMLSDWGSPNGKLDWGFKGEELNKLRKSASFGIRTTTTTIAPAAATVSTAPPVYEPDVSWVQSLVKDGPSAGWAGQQQYHHDGGDEFDSLEMLSPWAEQQLCMEQEQLAA